MEVLIRNFNTSTGKFDLFHEEIIDLTSDEIHQLILNLPDKTEVTIYVITNNRIFYKSGEYLYWRNNIDRISNRFKKFHLTEITENDKSRNIYSSLRFLKRMHLISYIVTIYLYLGLLSLPIINLFIIILNVEQIISTLSIFIIFIMLALSSLFTIILIGKAIKMYYFKEHIDIKLEYSSIENFYFRYWDLSRFIMLDLQFFFPFLLDIYSVFPLSSYIYHYWLILIIFSPTYIMYILIPSLLAFKIKKEISERKKIIKILQRRIQYESGSKQNFYLTLYLKLKDEKLIKIGLLTKISAIITFLPIFLT
ncbi:MAG: hypothetical protein ACFFCE_06650 [Promethearchaeota archaeon]